MRVFLIHMCLCAYVLVQVDGVLLLLGHRVGTTHSLFSSMPNVYRYLGMYCVTKVG